ncbi:hypothetical protein LOTGIDRAFT_163177 [Lottia gigantea]|uniref:Paraneoplastic antigen Ma-like C-terminal domain-containing protein n=1 Tax=Lottia gigantea TaxID=225164 RepID=V4AEN8_LOTGI|nr:hypothetical protein LOTGIDRAFT_163177 [Lottia gigantea]ESO91816.1 hypothetical protein LOTGIDRAFT_163177 [Lottia gigantea]
MVAGVGFPTVLDYFLLLLLLKVINSAEVTSEGRLEDIERAVRELSEAFEREMQTLEQMMHQSRRLNVSPASDYNHATDAPTHTPAAGQTSFRNQNSSEPSIAQNSRTTGLLSNRKRTQEDFSLPSLRIPRVYFNDHHAQGRCSNSNENTTKFEMTAEINQWSYEEKAKFLVISLSGKAIDIFGTLRADDVRDYQQLIFALKQKFDPPQLAEMYKVKLRERRRRPNESLSEFASSVRILVNKAYPTNNDIIKEKIAKDHFVQYFGDSQMRMLVSQGRPRDLNTGLHHAMELEAIKCSDPDSRTALIANVKDKHGKKPVDSENNELNKLI